MKPMFSYMGAKWRLAPHYGSPKFGTVVEPFAGSAAYSVYHEPRKAILVDSNPIIAGIWKYLIAVSETEIGRLPLDFDTVDDLQIPQEARWLIGFWLTKGNIHPNKSRSKWGRQYRYSGDCKVWGEAVRDRIVGNLHKIREWESRCESYEQSPNIEATWFIDPPYHSKVGKLYPHSSIDYTHLAEWCYSRTGQIIVCEGEGAAWLPFEPFAQTRGTIRNTKEVLFTR